MDTNFEHLFVFVPKYYHTIIDTMCHISLFLFANFVEKRQQDARCYFIVEFGARIERKKQSSDLKNDEA